MFDSIHKACSREKECTVVMHVNLRLVVSKSLQEGGGTADHVDAVSTAPHDHTHQHHSQVQTLEQL